MNFNNVKSMNPKTLVLAVLLSMLVFCISVVFDIPVVRQVISFLYLTFVPGFIIVKILKFKFNAIETVLFSIGLSIAFMLIVGVLTNELALSVGFMQPLSLEPLMMALTGTMLVLTVVLYFRCESVQFWNFEPIKKSPFSLLFLALPILSIVGAIYVNVYQNNLLLIFMIIAIATLFTLGVISKKLLPSQLYPLALLMIAIAILFHSSLISTYLISFGSDVPYEYFCFKTTQNNAYWTSDIPAAIADIGVGTYNDMLSITILPTIYANVLNLDPTLVFKIIYPLIFSFVPLAVYQIWQTYFGKKSAFIAAFMFMAQMTFYVEMLGVNRQMIAELFFLLLITVILSKKVKTINKIVCFTIFSFALVTSHYAVATIFLFFIAATSILLIVRKRQSQKINISMVVIFFVIMFSWYIYTGNSASFHVILQKIDYVNGQIGGFFDLSSRGETIMTGLGLVESPSIWNTISRIFAYIVQGLIVLGFIGLASKRKEFNIEKEYFIFITGAISLLAMLIVVPGLANTLNMTRFYHILLFFLAPLCVLGASFILKLFSNRPRKVMVYFLLLLVIVPYFVFQTNLVYEVTDGDSWSIPLSVYRMDPSRLYGHAGYTDTYSVYGAHWLAETVDTENSLLYADERTIANVLTIHALLVGGIYRLSNVTVVENNGVVYLSSLNVVYGKVPYMSYSFNTTELSPIFDNLNKIYANGGSEVYHNPE